MGLFSFLSKSRSKDLPQLRLHNTLSGKTEDFSPLSSHTVKMYNCGPTVYDEQHVGNLRGPVLADILHRTLEVGGYRVAHVNNITDVGHLTGDNLGNADVGVDRMEASAKKRGRQAQDVAQEITGLFFADLDRLGIDRKKIRFPRATEYIAEQIALAVSLEQKGYTYRTSDGVYFDTAKFSAYGKLGNLDLKNQQAGARVEENKEKRNPHDFALWKFSPADERRQQEWPSPWGTGFPGWHLECTAMIFALLGKQIDIHIGGRDLAPIHHNNEIAQAESATSKPFVNYWMHNEFITIEGKKVSKSLGNTVYLRQLVDRGLSPMALRYWYLTGHYRTPMNLTWEALEGADQALKRLSRHYADISQERRRTFAPPQHDAKAILEEFYAAIADDLNTPKALALVWKHLQGLSQETLKTMDAILGLGLADVRPAHKLNVVEEKDLPQEVQELVAEREAARANRDFIKADELRSQIEARGYAVVDTDKGPKLSKK